MRISDRLVSFIADYESLHDGDLGAIGIQPKLDASNDPIWTEGYGHAILVDGDFATLSKFPTIDSILPHSMVITEDQAKILLYSDLELFENGVNKRLTIDMSQCAFDSLVSHAYNCGYSSTMYKLINSNAPEPQIKEWYTKHYIRAGGDILRGLQRRRNDEYEMRINGDYKRS